MLTKQDLIRHRAVVGHPEASMICVVNRDVRERIYVPEGSEVVVTDTWQEPYFIAYYDGKSFLVDGEALDKA